MQTCVDHESGLCHCTCALKVNSPILNPLLDERPLQCVDISFDSTAKPSRRSEQKCPIAHARRRQRITEVARGQALKISRRATADGRERFTVPVSGRLPLQYILNLDALIRLFKSETINNS